MRRFIIISVIVLGFAAPAAAQWSPTTPLVLPGAFDIPLNSSSVSQTKSGALTVGGGYIAGTAATNTDLVVNGQICWNTICKNTWESIGSGNFVHLFTNAIFTPDSGYPQLIGDAALSDKALVGRAGVASALRTTVGLYGKAAGTPGALTSVGVFGDSINAYGYGVYGYVGGNTSASAGTFNGHVRVAWPYDLIIGPVGANAQAARQNSSVSFVCLGDASGRPFNDVCKSGWDSGSTSSWSLNGNVVWPSSTSTIVVAGGIGSAAKFQVDPHPDFTTDVVVSNATTTNGMVIGSPASNTPLSLTCGDGICNGAESTVFTHPNFCAIDCDHVPPGPIADLAKSTNVVNRTATFVWDRPSGDARGTLVLSKVSSPSTSPTDGTVMTSMLVTSCSASTCTYTTPTLSTNVTYYFTFYVFDYAPNYSTSVYTSVRFSTGGSPPPDPPPVGGGF